MTDSELRRLEREFREQGTVEAEAAWIRARLQAGELSQERLELSAYCGHLGSLAALPEASTGAALAVAKAVEFGGRWGFKVALRARAGVIAAALSAWESARPGDMSLRDVSVAADACLLEPNDETWSHLANACQEVGEGQPDLDGSDRISSLFQCGLLLQKQRDPQLADLIEVAWFAGLLFADESHADYEEFRTLPLSQRGLGLIQAAVQADLVPWALGYRDPVRERVEARQREAAGE